MHNLVGGVGGGEKKGTYTVKDVVIEAPGHQQVLPCIKVLGGCLPHEKLIVVLVATAIAAFPSHDAKACLLEFLVKLLLAAC